MLGHRVLLRPVNGVYPSTVCSVKQAAEIIHMLTEILLVVKIEIALCIFLKDDFWMNIRYYFLVVDSKI